MLQFKTMKDGRNKLFKSKTLSKRFDHKAVITLESYIQ